MSEFQLGLCLRPLELVDDAIQHLEGAPGWTQRMVDRDWGSPQNDEDLVETEAELAQARVAQWGPRAQVVRMAHRLIGTRRVSEDRGRVWPRGHCGLRCERCEQILWVAVNRDSVHRGD